MRSRRQRFAERAAIALATILLHGLLAWLLLFGAGLPASPAQDEHPEGAPIEAYFIQAPTLSSEAAPPSMRPRLRVPRVQLPDPVEILVPAEPAPAAPQGRPTQALTSPTDAVARTSAPAREAGHQAPSGGGSGAAGSALFTVVRNVVPTYPWRSARRHEQGTTTVGVRIDSRGRPVSVTVLKTSGFQALDEAAVHAVRKWRFGPPPPGRQAGDEQIRLYIGFHLIAARIHYPTVVVPFDAALLARINAAAASSHSFERSNAVSDDAVHRMAEAMRMANRPAIGLHSDFAPRPELNDMGPVQSVSLLGTVTRALDVDFDQPERTAGIAAASNRHLLWYAFAVRQELGDAEWLIGTEGGAIRSVEVMAKVPECALKTGKRACTPRG